MTPKLARRILLALMDSANFDFVAAVTGDVSRGLPVQIDLGFTPAEIRRAKGDRAGMKRRYAELKMECSFLQAANAARVEWLTGVETL